jgi:hypothetical protein
MVQLTKDFYLAGRALSLSDDPEERKQSDCWLCHLPIDYVADPNTTPDSHNLDHYYTVDEHPELQEDPDNFRHSHALCNQQRKTKHIDGGGLGEMVPQWW